MLSRLALRLSMIEALRPLALHNAAPPVNWPTLAEKYVFDSEIGPLDDLKPETARPVAVVYTGDDRGQSGQSAGGPPFKHFVDAEIHLSLVMKETDDNAESYVVGFPFTTPEMEASLDLFESQVKFALFAGNSGHIFRWLTGMVVENIDSEVLRSGEEKLPLAARILKFRVRVPEDCYDPLPAGNETGLVRLPSPLREVIEHLGGDAFIDAIKVNLGNAAPLAPVIGLLAGVNLEITAQSPPSEVDRDSADISATAETS
jgi:hypothetical protein